MLLRFHLLFPILNFFFSFYSRFWEEDQDRRRWYSSNFFRFFLFSKSNFITFSIRLFFSTFFYLKIGPNSGFSGINRFFSRLSRRRYDSEVSAVNNFLFSTHLNVVELMIESQLVLYELIFAL